MSFYVEDEFNNNSTSNDSSFYKDEFTQNKSVEFSSHRENSLPKDEFTSKDKKSNHTINNENLNNLTEKALESSAEATTVSGAAAASHAAATTSSVVVAASTVAVVAIGTVTGISVALHDYDYKFNLFSVSANELTYELFITDNKQSEEEMLSYEDFEHEREREENYPFTLRVYNATYDYSHSLWLGYNYNTFSGLTLGQTYNIVLSENRYGGEVLFEETFKTVATAKFNNFYIPGTANFVDKTIDVELDFVDATNSFNEFSLYLENVEFPEEMFMTYTLEAKPGKQALPVINEDVDYFDFHSTYNYKFSYRDKGETVDFSSGQVSFTDTSGEVTVFNSITIDNVVDFEGGYFNATLDYYDPLDSYYAFGLQMETMSGAYVTNNPLLFLETKVGEQRVYVEDNFDFNENYNYTLFAYTYDGEEEIGTGTVDFQDMYGRKSCFNNFVFDKTANFKTGEISFALDYVDELNYFDQFVVTFTGVDENSEVSIALDSNTDEQLKLASECDLSLKIQYTYKLTALYKGTEITLVDEKEPFEFTDNYAGSSAIYGLMFIGGEAKYSDRSFVVTLDYDDTFDCLDQFVLTLYDEENGTSIDLSLLEETVEQTLVANETMTDSNSGETVYKVDIVSHTITYNVSCIKDEGGNEETIELFNEPQPVSFTNSEFISFEYTGALYQMNPDDYYMMGMKFNYIDPDDNIYSNWEVTYYNQNNVEVCRTNLTNDDRAYEWSNYPLMPSEDTSNVESIIDNYCTIRVSAFIYDENTGIGSYDVELYRFENETLRRSEEVDPKIYGIALDNYTSYGQFEFYANTMVYQGAPDMFADVQLVIETRDGVTYTYEIDVTNEPFTIFLNQPLEDNFNDEDFESQVSEPVTIKIKYRYYIPVNTGTGSGTTSSDPEYELSELIELTCYNDFQFEIGH